MSTYEVHLGSGNEIRKRKIVPELHIRDRLIPYVKELGFTHIELLPVMEHPSTRGAIGSSTAPTSRHGNPDDSVISWTVATRPGSGNPRLGIPGHFPKDAHGLARYDGTCSTNMKTRGSASTWTGARSSSTMAATGEELPIGNALFWLDEYHVDGLRVDAVASCFTSTLARPGQWLPNMFGGRENLDAIAFMKRCNGSVTNASRALPPLPRNQLRGQGFQNRPIREVWALGLNGTCG